MVDHGSGLEISFIAHFHGSPTVPNPIQHLRPIVKSLGLTLSFRNDERILDDTVSQNPRALLQVFGLTLELIG